MSCRKTTFILLFITVAGSVSSLARSTYSLDSAFRFYELKKEFSISDRVNVLGKKLCVEYDEVKLREGEVTASIMDWNRDELIEFQLSTKYGKNRYVIDLENLPYEWEENTNYWFEITGGDNIKYWALFQLLPPVLDDEPIIDIVTDVKYSSCDELVHSMIDFLGSIETDHYPCKLEWNILSSEGVKLHDPVIEVIEKDEVSKLTVLDNPTYLVNLKVEDSCGNQQFAKVEVTCPTFEKSKLHIYFEKGLSNNKDNINGH